MSMSSALDHEGNLILADLADEFAEFQCIACLHPVAVNAEKTAFVHIDQDVEDACQYAGYLHGLAKMELAIALRDTKAMGKKLILAYEMDLTCNLHEGGCVRQFKKELDLARANNFEFLDGPADYPYATEMVLDFGAKSILIEVNAGYSFASEKIDSPCIELFLKDLETEADIECIRACNLLPLKAKAHNFPLLENTDHSNCECRFKANIEAEKQLASSFRSLTTAAFHAEDGQYAAGQHHQVRKDPGRNGGLSSSGSLCCTCAHDTVTDNQRDCLAGERIRPMVLQCESYFYEKAKNIALQESMRSEAKGE